MATGHRTLDIAALAARVAPKASVSTKDNVTPSPWRETPALGVTLALPEQDGIDLEVPSKHFALTVSGQELARLEPSLAQQSAKVNGKPVGGRVLEGGGIGWYLAEKRTIGGVECRVAITITVDGSKPKDDDAIRGVLQRAAKGELAFKQGKDEGGEA